MFGPWYAHRLRKLGAASHVRLMPLVHNAAHKANRGLNDLPVPGRWTQ